MISAETESGYKIDTPCSFGDYVIIKYEGNGWSSVVYKVRKKKSNKYFAAKVISKKDMIDKNSLEDVYNEITIHKSLNHPHIIKLLEILEVKNFNNEELIIIIEEYCSKGSLLSFINKSSFKNKHERKNIEQGIIEGVRYLHGIGYAHCDIKPENILLDKNMNGKLSDFGLCQYCSNENSIFFKNDIYSIGFTLYILAEGKEPNKTMIKNGHLLVRTENEKLKSLIERCTSFDLKKRPSIYELCNDEYFLNKDDDEKNENFSCNIIEIYTETLYTTKNSINYLHDISISFESLIDIKFNKNNKKNLKKTKRKAKQRKQPTKIKQKSFGISEQEEIDD